MSWHTSIENTVKIINQILDRNSFCCILDIGHYIEIKANKWRYNGIVYGCSTMIENYQKLVEKAPLKLFRETLNESCDINKPCTITLEKDYKFSESFAIKQTLYIDDDNNIFDSKKWAKCLLHNQHFSCMLVSSYVVGDHHSAVWVIISGKKPNKNQRKKIYYKLKDILLQTLLYNTESYYNDLTNKIKQEAVRKSLSQVMARNLSHNIGSHVLDKVSTLETYDTEKMQKFLTYLNNRMDYIADISTSTPVVEITTSLKENVIKGFSDNELLKEYISATENFKFSVSVKEPDNNLIVIPNDVLGMQAFYTILENIIRNTAKHSKVDNSVTFNILVEEVPKNIAPYIEDCNEMLSVSIVIEYERDTKKIYIKKEANTWKEVEQNTEPTICKVDDIDWLVYNLNSQINKSVLDDGHLRQGGWGLLEMEASAAYLRKIPMEEIEEEKYKIKILKDKSDFTLDDGMYNETTKHFYLLKAYKKDDNLAYRFFLYKPREILFIGRACDYIEGAEDSDKPKELLKKGIKFVDCIESDTRYPHKLVFHKPEDKFANKYNLTSFSPSVTELKKKFQADNILEEAWKQVKKPCGFDTLTKRIDNHGSYFASLGEDDYCQLGTSINSQWRYNNIWPGDLRQRWWLYCGTKFTVIDERIQEFAKQPSTCQDILYSKVYHHIWISVPDKRAIDLKSQNFDDMINNTNDRITEYISKQGSNFVVIHLGIIEKLIASYNRSIKTTYNKDEPTDIQNFIKEKMKLDLNTTVIVSGRSKPSNLPKDIRYLNYSVISGCLINKQCKYSFAEAIYSSRSLNHR